jgi:hypothetical protein
MWLNFTNCNGSDVVDVLRGKERRSCSILCQPEHAMIRQSESNDIDIWVVSVVAKYGTDPKAQFTDKEKAYTFYKHLCELIANETSADLDVVMHGAI